MALNEKALKLHEEWNGKLETTAKCQVKSREDLALAYTPGVAEPCKVIANDSEAAYRCTIKANTVSDNLIIGTFFSFDNISYQKLSF
jgi:malate dehydrogenase (oxaloacetate-decarboxylating)